MSTKRWTMVLVVCGLLGVLACGPLGSLGNMVSGSQAGTAANLWRDVPAYPGADKVDLELPLVMRVAVEAASKAIMTQAGDAGGNLEFIAYTTSDSPDDVQAFYTDERMAAEGWTNPDATGCTGATAGQEGIGGMCIFGKEGDPLSSVLFIVAGPQEGGDTSIFYIRIDANAEAMATAAAQ